MKTFAGGIVAAAAAQSIFVFPAGAQLSNTPRMLRGLESKSTNDPVGAKRRLISVGIPMLSMDFIDFAHGSLRTEMVMAAKADKKSKAKKE